MFSVDEKKCEKCGTCSSLCLSGVIKTKDYGFPFEDESGSKCIGCGQCVSFCPTGACRLDSQPEDGRDIVNSRYFPLPESASVLLCSRRSTRRFKEADLPRYLIGGLLEIVRYAPTARNAQPVRWIVSETRERTKAIAGEVIEIFRKNPDPRLAGVVAAWDGGYDIITRGAPNLALAVVPSDDAIQADGAIALTYLELYAHANKVGCCWAGFVTLALRSSQDFRRSLGVRDDETVSGGQMMGFPLAGFSLARRLPPRKKTDLTWI